MKSLYEQLGGTYHEGEDGLLYPELLPPEEMYRPTASMAACALHTSNEHRPALYTSLLLSGKLNAHLNEIDEAANIPDGTADQADGNSSGRHWGTEGTGSDGMGGG